MGEGRVYDFRSTGNPMGTPEEIRQAVRAAADLCDSLPADMEEDLERAIGQSLGIPPSQVCCGGGTASLVYRSILAFQPGRALVPVPSWPLFGSALSQWGCQVEEYVLREHDGFRPGASLREMLRNGKYDMVFLVNPAVPTGGLWEKSYLTDLIYTCRKTGTRVVLDECFMDLVMGPERFSLLPAAAGMSGVILLKSFSSAFCMSGLRLAYAVCGSEEDAIRLRENTGDQTVSVAAYLAGKEAIRSGGVSDEIRVRVAMERERLVAGLLRAGLRVFPSQANYLLFQSPWDLKPYLDSLGIRLKEVTEEPGLPGDSGYFYRVGLRDPAANGYLVEGLCYAVREQRKVAPIGSSIVREKEF